MKELALTLVKICDTLGEVSGNVEKLADKFYFESRNKDDSFCKIAEELGTLSCEIEKLADKCFYLACDIDASKD